MKICKILFVICLLGTQAKGQIIERPFSTGGFGNYIYFNAEPNPSRMMLGGTLQGVYVPDSDVSLVFEKGASPRKLSSSVALGVKLDPDVWSYAMAPIQSFSKSIPAFRLKDKLSATVIALGINKSNVSDYRYRVVINDSVEVIRWSPIPKLDQKYGAKQAYGFIGSFSYPGKHAFVEVVNIKNYNIRSGAVFDWRTDVKPFVFAVVGQASSGERKQSINFSLDRDSVTGRVKTIHLEEGSAGSMLLHMRPHPGLVYSTGLTREEDGQTKVRLSGQEEDINGVIRFDVDTLKQGKYEIRIYPKIDGIMTISGQDSRVELDIYPKRKTSSILEKKASFKQLIPYIIGAVLVTALLFWLYRRRANAKLLEAAQARQNVSLKMRTIRAQLNPHFMFNALTSIQNLVNKKDMEGANHYLSRFADLTRKVLYTSERDLISLEDEVKILDDYLQMEQLRFNFQYNISIDDNVNAANIEVPAMLLQPFVENAVKHGVSNLREKGVVNLRIEIKKSDLTFLINDNGLGFKYDDQKAGTSFGLKLSEERIALLNEVYKEQPVRLNIQSDNNGTTITVILTNWIS